MEQTPARPKKSIDRIAREALEVQNACNLSGVVRSFVEALDCLWDEAHRNGKGTAWVNQHAICKAYADKIVDLAKARKPSDVSLAFGACEAIADAVIQ